MKNARPQTTEASALDKRNDTAQQTLPGIESPPFLAQLPAQDTHAADTLARLLTGERLTQPSYGFHGWRLAAYIKELDYLGWPIQRQDVPPPRSCQTTRPIREYWLKPDTICAAMSMRGVQ
jgi:hypothetical protein